MSSAPPGEEALDPLVGRMFAGTYRVRRLIARGSMGRVYQAEQVFHGFSRPVALKLLEGPVSPNDPRSQRFLREASQLARLSHENIVQLYDHGFVGTQPYLAMEYVDGPTVRDLMAQGQLSPLRAVRLLRQVCGALGEAHALGLIHRDLKPANLIVAAGPKGRDLVKVIDFGLVKNTLDGAHMTTEGQLLGTPMFMAPEQVRGLPIDGRCDIYALGMVLYRALTHAWPFPDDDATAVLIAQLNVEPRTFEAAAPDLHLPEVVEWTVRRCLEKDRERRFRDVKELSRALRLCEAALLDESTMTSLTGLHLVQGRVAVAAGGGERRMPRWAEAAITLSLAVLGAACMVGGTLVGFVLVKGMLWAIPEPPPVPDASTVAEVVDAPTLDAPSPILPAAAEGPQDLAPIDAPASELATDTPPRPKPKRRARVIPPTEGTVAGDLVDPWSEVSP